MTRIKREKPAPGYCKGTAKNPRLPAYLVGKQLRVWCGWCDAWHYHGAGEPSGQDSYPAYGHRVAHCHTDSPYTDTGYTLTDPTTIEKVS